MTAVTNVWHNRYEMRRTNWFWLKCFWNIWEELVSNFTHVYFIFSQAVLVFLSPSMKIPTL